MVAEAKHMTVEGFDQFVDQPENADKLLEYVAGEIVEVPSNAYTSKISALVLFFIMLFVREKHIEGHVTGEAGGYMVSGERYAPDVAFISAAKQPVLAKRGYNPAPPDLAVEVDFPSSDISRAKLRVKIANYLAAGTVVWVVNVEPDRLIEVYTPGLPVKIVGMDGALDGGDVLPGFTLAVKDIFPEQPTKDE